jgi:hypothetical protein
MMKALIRDRYGPPDVLEVKEVERPVPKEGEVLVCVRAASLNDWDWGLLHGPSFPLSRAAPKPILGSDIAGRITEVGSGVQHFRVGDDVYGDLSRAGSGGWGGFAEYVCARVNSRFRFYRANAFKSRTLLSADNRNMRALWTGHQQQSALLAHRTHASKLPPRLSCFHQLNQRAGYRKCFRANAIQPPRLCSATCVATSEVTPV